MTLSVATIKSNLYTGNGSTVTFAYPFRIFASADLVVKMITISTGVETILTETTHYTVNSVGSDTGDIPVIYNEDIARITLDQSDLFNGQRCP